MKLPFVEQDLFGKNAKVRNFFDSWASWCNRLHRLLHRFHNRRNAASLNAAFQYSSKYFKWIISSTTKWIGGLICKSKLEKLTSISCSEDCKWLHWTSLTEVQINSSLFYYKFMNPPWIHYFNCDITMHWPCLSRIHFLSTIRLDWTPSIGLPINTVRLIQP